MFTKYDLITLLISEYDVSMQADLRNMFAKEKDSFFESQLPVKVIRKGYFVIS